MFSKLINHLILAGLMLLSFNLRADDNELEEWILSVTIPSGQVIDDGLIAYHNQNEWYFSVEDITSILKLRTQTTNNQIVAAIDDQQYQLGSPKKFSDIPNSLISLSQFDRAFACNSRIHMKLSVLVLDCDSPIPAIEKIKRHAITPTAGSSNRDEIFNKISNSEQSGISGPFVDLNFLSARNLEQERSNNELGISTMWGGPNQSLATFHSLSEQSSAQHRFTYYNNSQRLNNDYFTELSAIDVYSQGIPLIRSTSIGKGATATNFPKYQLNTYSRRSFAGELQPGWEVELYRDNRLLERQTSQEGRYLFLDIPLLYGLNRFTLRFIGPYGERREENFTYNINSEFIDKKVLYSLSIIDEELNSEQLARRKKDNLTKTYDLIMPLGQLVSFHLFGEDNFEAEQFFGAGFSFLTPLGNITIDGAKDPNDHIGLSAQYATSFKSGVLSVEVAELQKYQSELYTTISGDKTESIYKIDYNKNLNFILPLNFQTTLKRERFTDERKQDQLVIGLSSQYRDHIFDFKNTWDHSKSTRSTLNINHLYTIEKWRFREELTARKELERIRAELIFSPIKRTDIKAGATLNLQGAHDKLYNLGFGKSFEHFALNLNFDSDTKKNHNISLRLNFGMQRDNNSNRMHFYPQGTTNKGAMSVTTFLDENYNGLKDADEIYMQNVGFSIKDSAYKEHTNEDGVAFFGNLPLYWPLQLVLDLSTIEDPSLFPAKDNVYFICRRGNINHYELPIVRYGDAEFFLDYTGKRDPFYVYRSLEVDIYDSKSGEKVATEASDEDGFMIVPNLKLGTYKAKLNQEQLNKRNLKVLVKEITFQVTKEETSVYELRFKLTDRN